MTCLMALTINWPNDKWADQQQLSFLNSWLIKHTIEVFFVYYSFSFS